MSRTLTTPWTLRACDVLPGSPFSIGIVFAIVLLAVFFIGRALLMDGPSDANDLRIAITQILMTAYSAAAYAYLLLSARRTTRELAPVLGDLPDREALIGQAGRHPGWVLIGIGAGSFLVLGIGVTNLTTLGSAWDWQNWSYDVAWHRATTVLFAWWVGCLCYVVMVESARLSRLAGRVESLDPLNMQPWQPLVRQGLTNALLVIGLAAVMSLLGIEARYWPAGVGFLILFTVLAWIGLMLPLRGIRRQFRAARRRELDWCQERLRAARDALKAGADADPSMADTAAYRTVLENLRNWPFDHSTLVRFTLYLLIPLGSWLGGALVERALDLVLS